MSLYIKPAFNNILLAGTNEIAFRIVYYHIFKKYSNWKNDADDDAYDDSIRHC